MERSPNQHVYSSPCLKILFTWKSCIGLNQFKIHPIGKDVIKLETFLIQSKTSIMDDIWGGYASFLETHSNCHSNTPLSFKHTETSWDDQLTKLMGRKPKQTDISWVSAECSILWCDAPGSCTAPPRLHSHGRLLSRPRAFSLYVIY